MSLIKEVQVKNLDHLGIVAGIIDEIGIVEIINSKLGTDCREKITSGQIVKAIILNGLGFVSKPLYLFSQFFEDKAIEELLGQGIKSQYINDDKIGRVMDELFEFGLNNIFLEIVLTTLKKFEIQIKYGHLDATSFHLHGKYLKGEKPELEEEIIKERPITITHGYSRDHRPDLKQCVLDLITSSDGDIPLFMRAGDGNESDKAVFGKILLEFKKQISFDNIMVCDSALYSQDNLQLIKDLLWISRVPMTIKKAKELVNNVEIEEIDEKEKERRKILKLEGYQWKEKTINYGGINQIWLIVESVKRKISDLNQLEEKLKKEKLKIEKKLNQLRKEQFTNPEQAQKKLQEINSKNNLFKIEEVNLIESQSKDKKSIYKIEGEIQLRVEEIAKRKKEAGRFILATNLIDENKLNPEEILTAYKNQQSCERGFRFLKDPLFFADSFFVKNPERVETMLCLMSLSLLVYNLGQRELRNQLKKLKTGVKNQLNKLTSNPTLRWIFQCFQGIHVVILNGTKQVVNLTKERSNILEFLPEGCRKYYVYS